MSGHGTSDWWDNPTLDINLNTSPRSKPKASSKTASKPASKTPSKSSKPSSKNPDPSPTVAATPSDWWSTSTSPAAPPGGYHAPSPAAPQRRSGVFDKDFALGKKLGEGAFGTAYMVTSKPDGSPFACKTVAKAKLVRREDREAVLAEVKVLKKLSEHPHVAALEEFYDCRGDYRIVMELCRGGELFDRIVAKGKYSERDASAILRTMLETIAFCHLKGIVHRDLKPENFLFESPAETAALKMIDFGLAADVGTGPTQRPMTEKVGTPFYVAPEVLNNATYDRRVDVYSLGCILYVLLCGRPVFNGRTDDEIIAKTRKGVYDLKKEPWPAISSDAKDLVTRMLALDPHKRPDAAELLKHPWVRVDGSAPNDPLMANIREGVREFYEMNKLKKQAMLMVARHVKGDEVKKLKKLFISLDVNRTGEITITQLRAALNSMGRTSDERELERIFTVYDVDNSGTISYEEFITACSNMATLNNVDAMRAAFKEFDRNGDGVISPEEVYKALKQSGVDRKKAEQMVKEVDANGDGNIDFEEFCEMMKNEQKDELASAAKSVRGIRGYK
eukprot:CAMPEP_0184712566 /NCGR_PEP_ID=MMETSP0314-20130426/3082_1 /TAXON_ID=38298 /ORGANISM="Rhodella maculata, Strain CCMP 736" /LENGTH=561 /DNA_ID=CAMNT_0027175039 /DNA_START=44 /DNA_END=1732 /DNA_ORIENTATION=-